MTTRANDDLPFVMIEGVPRAMLAEGLEQSVRTLLNESRRALLKPANALVALSNDAYHWPDCKRLEDAMVDMRAAIDRWAADAATANRVLEQVKELKGEVQHEEEPE